ncbi:54S ribosomal protein L31, mitochondrial [[Candida] anglica]|uniref:Large ribosomal subunit protein mL60 n=1 Tax=[Candida] anglica TaxID=148631 RepID=A0ABP0E699_9ASCO
MLGPFRGTLPTFGGLLWKRSWRMSPDQKSRLRKRMQVVDKNIEVLYESLKIQGQETTGHPKLDYLMHTFPKENEMSATDKYTTFNKNSKNYRKSVHHVPKWTKLSFRENPKYF